MTKADHKLRIVIDSNVWISGLIFGGNPGKIIQLFIADSLIVVTSEEILSELRRNITQKFPLYTPQLELVEASLRKDTEMVKIGLKEIAISRDADDDKIIETAVIGNCSYIISGDNDLLSIKNYEAIRIISPAEFLTLMSSGQI